MKMTLRQLSVFDCVTRHMSFTKAAESMCLTQPAVSIQIKQLEEHIGLPLFEHVGKKLFLTQAGEELKRACGDIFSRLENLEMALTQMKGVMQGSLRIACVTSAKYFAPHLLGEFHRQYPEVQMSLMVTNRDQILRRLINNEDDLALMAQVPDDMKLCSYPILDNPMIAIAPPGHPLVGQKRIPIEALAEESFLMREQGSGSRKAIEDHLRNNGVELSRTMELGSSETIKQGVMAGLGLSILSRHSVALELATGCLKELDVASFPIIWTWCFVHHQEKKLSPAAQAFLDHVVTHRETVKELICNRFLGAAEVGA
ncbi:LysR family transcriptional regulator [Motiliproteus sp. SC1-56]|uniref:LysR family transcriptional regulator n=1 Tax=Motiliproteus sp. SC1-56 TaxID=2799565 RepID=UPI001A8F166E|nr:LysR family transcriptional regulator [Motiliproteus sp. SC1-56]